MHFHEPRTRLLTIVGQDPALRYGKKGDRNRRFVLDQIEVPIESLWPGPMGHRVHVIDFDASTQTLYKADGSGTTKDPLADGDPYEKYLDGKRSTKKLLSDPFFHQQNVYAIVMNTLSRFEYALGRRVGWGFDIEGHQLKVVPHAFFDTSAFYSRQNQTLQFGYFKDRSGENTIFSCLARDVIVHETTHAVLDGLKKRFLYPSSPDQAAFHEGFADVVAILSVFHLPRVLNCVFQATAGHNVEPGMDDERIEQERLTKSSLKDNVLMGIAKEMGQSLDVIRGRALRQSLELTPPIELDSPEFQSPHRRGEVFVACMLNAFLDVWVQRLAELARHKQGKQRSLSRNRVIEEAREASDRLLNAAIRAIDYCPPTDLTFGDYLSAFLTADLLICPDDSKYEFRKILRDNFARFGIHPASTSKKLEPGMWDPCALDVSYKGVHFDPMTRVVDEVFRLVYENRRGLGLHREAFTFVQSVRPSFRVDLDGLIIRETVAEYVQVLKIRASELNQTIEMKKPETMDKNQPISLYGGGTLIFDEFGQLRFHIKNSVRARRDESLKRQQDRVEYLWRRGALGRSGRASFAALHRERSSGARRYPGEEW